MDLILLVQEKGCLREYRCKRREGLVYRATVTLLSLPHPCLSYSNVTFFLFISFTCHPFHHFNFIYVYSCYSYLLSFISQFICLYVLLFICISIILSLSIYTLTYLLIRSFTKIATKVITKLSSVATYLQVNNDFVL